jgi:hypothetical protein
MKEHQKELPNTSLCKSMMWPSSILVRKLIALKNIIKFTAKLYEFTGVDQRFLFYALPLQKKPAFFADVSILYFQGTGNG